MSIDPKRIEAALTAWRPFTVIRPRDVRDVGLYRALVGVLPSALRGVTSIILGGLEERSATVSVTLATPLDPVVVLSPAAVADDVTHAATVAHEGCHVATIARDGRAQTVVDYLGSGELRAQREADASAAGLWMRYVLTGALPDDAPTLGDLYHLDAGDAAMARQIIAAHLATIRAGVVPNLDVCVVLAKWFHAQTDIPADVLARVAVVP